MGDSNMPRADQAGKEGSGEEDGEYPPHSNDNNNNAATATAAATGDDNFHQEEGFGVDNGGDDDNNEGKEKAKYVEKLDVDEADVEEEMRRQWDMLSDEEKAYYEQAILEMEREKEAETLAQQECGNDTGGGSPASLSSVAPRGDIDIENEEGFAVCELSSPPNDCKEGDLPEVEASG